MDNRTRLDPTVQAVIGVLAVIDADELLDRLDAYRWTGRPGYSHKAMWRAIIAKYLLRLRHTRDLIARLKDSRRLRRACGFRDTVPHESTFSRFFDRLAQHQDLVDEAFACVTDCINAALMEFKDDGGLPAECPPPGRAVAIDSSDIPAYANSRRHQPIDADAAWGYRTPKNGVPGGSSKGELFFGYKLHALCDAYYGHPLAWSILPANVNDSPQLPPLMDRLADQHPYLPTRFLMGDKGYDGLSNYRYLDERRNVGGERVLSVILMRYTDRNGLYSSHGRPFCLGKREMEYVRTDRGKGHLFRCPDGGCSLLTESPWLGPCQQEHHENWQGDRLRKVGRLPRGSPRWHLLYNLRPSVERLFSSLKRTRMMGECRYLGIAKTRLHVSLSMLAYSATMLVRLLKGDTRRMRSMALDFYRAAA